MPLRPTLVEYMLAKMVCYYLIFWNSLVGAMHITQIDPKSIVHPVFCTSIFNFWSKNDISQ
jgi:hypothetical protein